MTTDNDTPVTAPTASPAPRGFGTAAMAAAIAVGLILGYAIGGWLVPKITTPGDKSIEAGFARDMTNHHAQAVEMGLIVFRRSTDPEITQYGIDIATAQQGEMGMMGAWLHQWGLSNTSTDEPMSWLPAEMRQPADGIHDGLMPGMATADEINKLRTLTGRPLDVLFLQLMIRHHLGGAHMIEAVLSNSDVDQVTRAVGAMRDAQAQEVKHMTTSLTARGAKPLPA